MTLLNRLRHRRPLAALLLIAALLAGQAVAAAHLHADHLVDASCAVCTLAKAEAAPCDSHVPIPRPPAMPALPAGAELDGILPVEARAFHPRGPPRI